MCIRDRVLHVCPQRYLSPPYGHAGAGYSRCCSRRPPRPASMRHPMPSSGRPGRRASAATVVNPPPVARRVVGLGSGWSNDSPTDHTGWLRRTSRPTAPHRPRDGRTRRRRLADDEPVRVDHLVAIGTGGIFRPREEDARGPALDLGGESGRRAPYGSVCAEPGVECRPALVPQRSREWG